MPRTTTAILFEGLQEQSFVEPQNFGGGITIGLRQYQDLTELQKRSCFCSECGWKLYFRGNHFAHNPGNDNNPRPWCSTMVHVNDRGVVTRQADVNELQRRGLLVELDFPPIQPREPQPRQQNPDPVPREAPRHFTSIDTLAQHLPVYLNRAIRVNGEVRIISDMLISSELHGHMESKRDQGPFIWFARVVQYNPSHHNFLNYRSPGLPDAFQLTREATAYREFNAANTEGRVILAFGEFGSQVVIDDGRKVGRLPQEYEFLLGY